MTAHARMIDTASQPSADADIASLRRRLEDAIAERDAFAQDLFEASRHIMELTAQRQALLHSERAALERVATIHASTSWWLTKPVRFAARQARTFLQRARARLAR